MPRLTAIGIKTGMKIVIRGSASIIIPTIRKNMFTISKNIKGDIYMPNMRWANITSTRSTAIKNVNVPSTPNSAMIADANRIAFLNACKSLSNVRLRYMKKPTSITKEQARIEISVIVARPDNTPTIMIIGANKPGRASRNTLYSGFCLYFEGLTERSIILGSG